MNDVRPDLLLTLQNNLQKEWETKVIIRTSFGRDDLSQRTRNELISEWTFGYGL